jgi:hypothetical protein
MAFKERELGIKVIRMPDVVMVEEGNKVAMR